jgi:hypothetical protein
MSTKVRVYSSSTPSWGSFDQKGGVHSMGLRCAFCQSMVDHSFAPGMEKRLGG